MADNTALNTMSGGDVVRDVDRTGVKTQVVAIDLNPAGSESLMAGVMPISDNSGSLTVDGAVTANAGTNLNTSALAIESGGNLAAIAAVVRAEDAASADADKGVGVLAIRKATPANTSSTDGDYEFLQLSAGRLWTSTVVDTALPAGTNAIGKLATNTGVTIGAVELAASQTLATVTTITNVVHIDDNASSLTVDGTVGATQSGTWTVQPGNTANTTAWLTNHLDPAATTGNITAADAASTTTTNSVNQSIITGTPTANSAIVCTLTGQATVTIQVSGTATTTCAFERSIDGGTTYTTFAVEEVSIGSAVSSLAMSDNKAYVFRGSIGGLTNCRVRCTAFTSGTVAVKIQPSWGPSQLPVNQGVPAAVANSWPVKVTDGTNSMPTGDASARTIHTTIDNAFIPITDNNGSITIDGTITASNSAGDVAHDGVNSGNPVQIGVEAIAHGANPTAVSASGDRTKLYANRAGILFVMGGHPNVVTIEFSTSGAQTDTAIVTIGAGLKIVVTQIQAITDNAITAFPGVRVGFGTANTPTTTGVVLTHPGVPAGGGVSRGDGSGILGIGADNEDLRITCTAPTSGSLRILVTYYTCES